MNGSRGDLKQRVNLSDLIRYLITVSRQNGLMKVREDWLNPAIFYQIQKIWPEGPSLLISHLIYAGHYYCSSGLKFIKTVEQEVRKASKLEGNQADLVRCRWPFVLLDRLISERGLWIRKSLKMAYLPSRVHKLALETYPLEKEATRGNYQKDISSMFMTDENTKKRLISLSGQISPLIGLDSGLNTSVLLDYNSTNHKTVEKLWKMKYIAFSQVLMGYVAKTVSLIDIDQLTTWSKSTQMASKEMAVGLNKITVSFVYKLLKLPNPLTRAKIIIFLIEVATYCYQERDHTTSFLVTSSLQNNTIQRLKESWKLIPPKYIKQVKSISSKLGINPYDQFTRYFNEIYPSEKMSLSETGLINMVVIPFRITRLRERRVGVDSPIPLSQLRSNGHLFLPLYRWSAENQLKRYFDSSVLSDSDQEAIILFASPYANLTERMISDYMNIKERHESIRSNKKFPFSPSANLINSVGLNLSPINLDISLGNILESSQNSESSDSSKDGKISQTDISLELIPKAKPVIKAYPSFHTAPFRMSAIMFNMDLEQPVSEKTDTKEDQPTEEAKETLKAKETLEAEETKENLEDVENPPTKNVEERETLEAEETLETLENPPTKNVEEKETLETEENPPTKNVEEKENLQKEELPLQQSSKPIMAGALFIGSGIQSTIKPSRISSPIPNTPGPVDGLMTLVEIPPPPPPLPPPLRILSQVSLIDVLSLDMSHKTEPEISPRNEEDTVKDDVGVETVSPTEEKKRKWFLRVLLSKRISFRKIIPRRRKTK